MFGRSTNDVAEFLMAAEDEARVRCRHNRDEMARTMADWMSQDRRFDGIPDKLALAKEAMACRSHGRMLDISERVKSGASGPVGYVARQV